MKQISGQTESLIRRGVESRVDTPTWSLVWNRVRTPIRLQSENRVGAVIFERLGVFILPKETE